MTTNCYLQEAAKLAPKRADGTYPVVLISEGEGSSGRYSAELLEGSAHVFENSASFINHPIDPSKPHLRDVNSIGGRIINVNVGEDAGKTALLGDYKPRAEYVSLFEEFGDILGLSIFCGAKGTKLDDGRLDVMEFDASDPYRSVDVVVAAGRGGKFERAAESLRLIESSLGTPPAAQPGVTSAPGSQKEGNMDKEILEAIKALAASFTTFVTEQKAAATAATAAEADADAAEKEKTAALEAYVAADKAISDAKLLPSQVESLRAAALRGEDVTSSIAEAKKIADEAKAAVATESASGYVAAGATDSDDFSVARLGA